MDKNQVHYQHINERERHKIEGFRDVGWSVRDIARALGRDPSTISRELRRHPGSGGGYSATNATCEAKESRIGANVFVHKKLKPGTRLTRHVESKLRQYWSPEQIVGRRNFEGRKRNVSVETIYRFIANDRPDLRRFLRLQKGRYRRRRGTQKRAKQRYFAHRRSITERPATIEKRTRLGHWEGDTVLGKEKSSRFLTHVERKSGVLFADKIDACTADLVGRKTVKRFRRLPKRLRQTVTYDNGVEFSDYERTERDSKMIVYFARPYHSWERGTNENTNGLLRQFFPKKIPLKGVTQKQLDRVVRLLNTRPRKRHGYRTPDEVFTG